MMAFRWSRVALLKGRVGPSAPFRQPALNSQLARHMHSSMGLLKDSKGKRDPKDSDNLKDTKDARNAETDSALDGHAQGEKDTTMDPAMAAKAKGAGAKHDTKADFKGDPESDGTQDVKSDAKADSKRSSVKPDTRQPWSPPAPMARGKDLSAESAERRERILRSERRRDNKSRNDSGMFNPGDGESGAADEGGNDTPPITKQERLLPIQLQYRPVFPGMASHFVSSDPKLTNAVRKLRDTRGWDHRVVAVMSKAPIKTTQLITNVDDVHQVGCVCLLDQVVITHSGVPDQYNVHGVLYPQFRVRVGELVENVKAVVEAVPEAEDRDVVEHEAPASDAALDQVTVQYMKGISALPNEPYAVKDDDVQRLSLKIIDNLREMSMMSTTVKSQVEKFSELVPQNPGGVFKQPDFLADFAASLIPKNDALQQILETTNVAARLRLVTDLVSKEVTYLRVQDGIYRYGNNQTEQRNREMILHEYLRYIKKELGMENDDKSRSAEKFLERIEQVDMPPDVRKVFDEELAKFRSLEPTSGEYNTVRTFLDWLSSVPWGKFSEDRFDLTEARNILDKTHYGLEDVKDRILEFLAVGKLNGSVDGKIVCLAGPPGVGKTSIAKSVAESLNRKFDRFSVGGLHDPSEIKGHRRTYVAAMPGRIIQALKRTQTQNPVILIDEIDKLGRHGGHGDPSAALLEVLDPEQNKNFQDTYLEVPVDLSRVLFLCTANNLDTIPAPLMDRMEVINVPGYLPSEKVEIATNHLAPKAQRESGLMSADLNISSDAFATLVSRYTREAGVRGLTKNIEKIFRKIAYKVVSENAKKETLDSVEQYKLRVTPADLVKYVGAPVHNSDRMYETLPPGVSMGLGWTPVGGVPLFIESVLQEQLSLKSQPRLTRTGQLGEVMNESTSIAYSFARMFMTRNYPRNRFLDFATIHTHFPEGAIKKDGPSAGTAMATSLLSLAMNVPAQSDVAMTGELSLTGKVLQIGGLREKAVAAKTAGARVIIFPEDNRAEWEDMPAHVKEGMEPHAVKHYDEVFDIVFGNVDAAKVNSAWPELKEPKEGVDKKTKHDAKELGEVKPTPIAT